MKDIEVGSGPFRYRVDPIWGKLQETWGNDEAPAVACDAHDRVYVYIRGQIPVRVYDRQGNLIRTWGEGVFVRPHGIFVHGDTIYCIDDAGHTVRAFDAEGKPRMTLGDGKPSDTGSTSIDYRTIRHAGPPFNYPTNLAIGPAGDLYISDGYGNARVHCFSADGRLRHSWGEPGSGPGQFHVPHGIAVDVAGTVYVADRENSRIQLFDADGQYLREWTDVARPCQVFIDRAGWIYVAELGFRAGRWPGTGKAQPGDVGGRVSIFDHTGALHARWGGGDHPCAPGDFFAPHGIWVDSHGDIYVSEVTLSAGGRAGLVPPTCHTVQKFVRIR
jgi:DNA-binding beta-propeller fold protein YncE